MEEKVDEYLLSNEEIGFEITVLTKCSKDFLKHLKLKYTIEKKYTIEFIQILALIDLCLKRVKQRDATAQIKMSEEKND